MKPFQLFLPFLNSSFGLSQPGRQTRLLYSAWSGEGTVFLLPGTDQEQGATQPFSRLSNEELTASPWDWKVTAIPDHGFERVDIYHVSSDGSIVGPQDATPFHTGSVNGLLEAWLNMSDESCHRTRTKGGRELIALDIPFVGPRYLKARLPFPFECSRLSRVLDEPYEPYPYTRMCMELQVGPLQYSRIVDDPLYEMTITDRKRYPMWPFGIEISRDLGGDRLRWPNPINGFFPFRGSDGDLCVQRRMAGIVKKSKTQYQEALYEAKNEAAQYISEGYTTMELGWFWPTLLQKGEDAVRCTATEFGLPSTRNLKELQSLNEFQLLLQRKTPIRRVWGTLGFFWELLSQHLESQQSLICERCGRMITGKKGKKFCGREDNLQCFRDRGRTNRRKQRRRKSLMRS
jgi:hypothetical protein